MLSSLVQFLLVLLALEPDEKLDSKTLSRKIKQGDQQAFESFFNAHYDKLFRFLIARGIRDSVSQDLIQNAFLYIWENRSKIDEDKSLRSYLYRIAYTRMLNHIKAQKKFDESEDIFQNEFSDSDPAEELNAKELMQVVEEAVRNMPPKRRAVFELCFMQEFTYKETAEMMEISVNTVENHMQKAFKDVRTSVNAFYEKNLSDT